MKDKLLLSTTCLALCMGFLTLSSGTAQAQQEMGSMTFYDIPASEIQAHYNEWRVFMEYNLHRKQCQGYQLPPAGYVAHGCNIYRANTTVATTETVTQTEPAKAVITQSATVSSYAIHFAHDKSKIPANEESIVGEAAQEIQKDKPSSVVVSGYTSTTGTAAYNQALSERRAKSVADALVVNGVNPEIITQEGFGKTHLAVPTGDNVKMPANRRVLIQFNQ
jgi:outer membrane protein OmpA-like peptidoglycan-associated protein